VLVILVNFSSTVIDVQASFLSGKFEDQEELIMEVPQGFQKNYNGGMALKFERTIYGLKKAAFAFWIQ
jgi:hypothetical protein